MPEQKTILVVDDDLSMLDNLADILELNGFRVLKASDGLQALETLQEQNPDLILADVMMPEMNGYQLYQRVRRISKFIQTPFIFLTARGEIEDVRFGKELGADDYLLKPIQAEDLMAVILGKIMRYDELKKHGSGRIEHTRVPCPTAKSPHDLTSREMDVLRLMIKGLSNNEIAEALFIEESTVKTHVSNIISKLGVRNRVEVVAYAVQSDFLHAG